jgi:hypothetical protein
MTSLNDLLGDRTVDPDDTVVSDAGSTLPRSDQAVDDVDQDQPDDLGQPGQFDVPGADDLLDDDALRPPPRTSRLTIVLVALLILMVGFFAGVQVDRVVGAGPMRPAPSGASSASTSAGR